MIFTNAEDALQAATNQSGNKRLFRSIVLTRPHVEPMWDRVIGVDAYNHWAIVSYRSLAILHVSSEGYPQWKKLRRHNASFTSWTWGRVSISSCLYIFFFSEKTAWNVCGTLSFYVFNVYTSTILNDYHLEFIKE